VADTPDPIDLHVGNALRARRKLLELTQQQIAEAIGVSFQQLQKYERGTNRISASMLARIAAKLEAAPGDFFPAADADCADPAGGMLQAFAASEGGAELARCYLALDPPRQGALCRTAEALVEVGPANGGLRHVA
jgi:transcriptional regulator with XRE-family HTH domain